ncbi:MAG: c-type cytochrome [Gammaproteobacteria bacterium]
MTIGWTRLALIIAGLAAGGLLFAWSGLFNVAATTGHWALTEWFLHWTMHNSVRTHALGIEPPPLADPALVHRGAGHYAAGCVPCHGAPGEPQSPIARELTPMPPRLGQRVHEWERKHLFWIVKHGVKYTGMPAWVAQSRDDEVWAMVAFLDRLPEMTPAEYRRLAYGPVATHQDAAGPSAGSAGPPPDVLSECARCHGRDGAGRHVGAFPILSGQNETYLYNTLRAYARGSRHSGMMQPAASGLDDATLRALARHYARAARRTAAPVAESADIGRLRQGERIAKRGAPRDLVPPCVSCHGPKAGPRFAAYPRLAGQHPGYLAQQLRLYKRDARGGTAFGPIMQMIAGNLSEAQIRAVTAYYGSLFRKTNKALAEIER